MAKKNLHLFFLFFPKCVLFFVSAFGLQIHVTSKLLLQCKLAYNKELLAAKLTFLHG